MHKITHNHFKSYLFALTVILFASCSDDPNDTGTGIDGLNALIEIQDEAPGENCSAGGIRISIGQDTNANDILDDSEVTSVNFVCNGGDGGSSSLLSRTTEESAGENCENGGSLVELGIDQNGDGVLEDEEVQTSFYVCNGLDGNNGGDNGLTSLIVASPSNECDGITIQIGLDQNNNETLDADEIQSTYNICNGTDGANSLIECTVESAGQNCPNGGITVEIGVDTNQDGVLDTDEKIGEPKYICNGIDGTDGRSPIVNVSTDVPGCTNGGVELTFGYDNDTDGTVDDILQTVQICNGNDGTNGSDGNDGLNTIIETNTDPAGCPNGGVEIRIGLDRNRDGNIDETTGPDNELISTETICNGVDGTDGNNGSDGREIIMTSTAATCGGDGGQTYSFGYDNDGNGTIDELLTSFTICNGADGSNGVDGNSDGIFEFYISNGFNGYTEGVDVSINEQGNNEYNQILSVDFADANQSNSILYFPRLQELVESGVNGDPYEIVEAILYLRAAVPADPRTPPANEAWIGVKTLRSNAPEVRDGSATWTEADGAGTAWSSPGAAVTEDGGANAFSDMYSLPALFTFDGVVPLLLSRSEVASWTADESFNKGMVVTFAGSTVYEIDFYSSEYEADIYLRPTLYIKVQTNTRARNLTHEEYLDQWNSKSYEEKVAPLENRTRD